MKTRLFLTTAFLLLSACGYKGNLYLPKEGDNARFGVIQTGLSQTPSSQTTPTQIQDKP